MERTIEASTTIRAVWSRAREVLVDDPGSVLGDHCTAEQRRTRRFPMELAVEIGAGASVHQAVTVQLGVARPTDTGLVLPVTWKATGHERYLPTFDGELQIVEDRAGTTLRLTGSYAVPLGPLGRFGDGIAGRRLARRSLADLVEEIARRLDSEVARRLASVGWRPAPYPVALREGDHSEIYVG